VPARIENTGDIEVILQVSAISPGATASLIFKAWDDVSPPMTVKVRGPDGKILLERVIRDLPTGKPQSAPPITFLVAVVGAYKIEISQLYGSAAGHATLHVT
jgi:hypothetical protein